MISRPPILQDSYCQGDDDGSGCSCGGNPSNMIIYQSINLFGIGDTVSVSDIPEFQNVIIGRISDAGVTINGPKIATDTIISGNSPAVLIRRASDKTPVVEATKDTSPDAPKQRVERGTYTLKMKNLTMFEKDKSFTIKEFAELNNIPINYSLNRVKENCLEVGSAEKVEGQRGRTATLYIQK